MILEMVRFLQREDTRKEEINNEKSLKDGDKRRDGK